MDLVFTQAVAQTDQDGENKTRRALLISEKFEERYALRKLFYEFSSNTTAHGFLRVVNTKYKVVKAVWVLLILAALVGLGLNFYFILRGHLNNEVNTDIDLEGEPVLLPAVTYCGQTQFTTLLTKIASQNLSMGLPNYPNQIIRPVDLVQAGRIFFKNSAPFMNLSDTNVNIMALMASFPFARIGNIAIRDKYDLVVRCMVNGKKCNVKQHVIHIRHPNYGVCLLFQIPFGDQIRARRYGGLDVIFYVNAYNFVQEWSVVGENALYLNRGGDVFIHESGTYPDFLTIGGSLRIAEKLEHRVMFDQTTYNYFPPRSQCSEVNPPITVTLLPLYVGEPSIQEFKYTRSLCHSVLRQREMLQLCNCLSEFFPTPPDLMEVPYCTRLDYKVNASNYVVVDATKVNLTQWVCHERTVPELRRKSYVSDQCPMPCQTRQYELSVSQTAWAAAGVNPISVSKVVPEAIARQPPVANVFSDMIAVSLPFTAADSMKMTRLAVDPRRNTGTNITQSEAYPLINLISNTGGSLGLWIGLSIMGFGEIIELVVRAVIVIIRKCQA